DRALRSRVLESDRVQYRDSPNALVPARPRQSVGFVPGLPRHPAGNVAGAVHDRGHFAVPRFLALFVGHVFGDHLGLRDVYRHDRPVPGPTILVHSIPAHDFDFGDAPVAAAGGSAAGTGVGGAVVTTRPKLYGLLAEFEGPTDLVRAVRAARAAGYRRLD